MIHSKRRVTGSDVALAAGVSRTTVSFVLNNRPGQSIPDQTRRRVVEAASRLGYRPRAAARALAAGRSDIVLLSVPDLPLGAAITRFVEELAAALAAHGLTLVAHLAATHGGGSLSEVCASVDASVVIGLTPFPQRVVEELHRSGADVVIPTDKQQGATFPTEQIGRVQADYLIAKATAGSATRYRTDPNCSTWPRNACEVRWTHAPTQVSMLRSLTRLR